MWLTTDDEGSLESPIRHPLSRPARGLPDVPQASLPPMTNGGYQADKMTDNLEIFPLRIISTPLDDGPGPFSLSGGKVRLSNGIVRMEGLVDSVRRVICPESRGRWTRPRCGGRDYFLAQVPSGFWVIQPARAEEIQYSAKIFWIRSIWLASTSVALATSA
jgi:hypothetical protein